MPRIFISYSRVDRPFTERFEARLRRMFPDVQIWFDDHLHGGDVWWDEILSQIAQCDVFIYLLSNESVRSPYCHAEFSEARRLQKRIVTVQIRDRTELTDDLDDIQYVDMKDGVDDPDALTRLGGAVRLQLSKAVKKRPLWQPRTPKPVLVKEIPRPEHAPEVDTPTLYDPAPSTPSVQSSHAPSRSRSSVPWTIPITVFVTALITLVAAYLLLGRDDNGEPNDDQSQFTTQTAAALANNVTPQPSASAPATSAATSSAADNTNTPDPTNTVFPTLSPTSMPTPNPVQAPLDRAQTFSGGNDDWEPFVQDFQGVEMVLVPAGCFMMGSEDGTDDEMPAHRVCFDEPYWIDQMEVTNGQYAAFGGVSADTSFFSVDRPLVELTWDEAQAFCEIRAARLPTEAEWEYAARGPDGWIYPWGDGFVSDHVVWSENAGGQKADVGSKPEGVSWVGAWDLSGNVGEWVADWYDGDYYRTLEDGAVNPTGPASGEYRVLRGGSWLNNYSGDVRAAFRNWTPPDAGDEHIGFRCARSN